MKETAVVILNWNGEDLLKSFLSRVIANTPDADVIVADNGSTDGSVAWIKSHYPGLQLILFDRNYGYADGYNRAIGQLSCYQNIILLNSDAAPAPGWIAPLEKALSLPGVVAAQSKLLSERDHACFEYAGAAGGLLDCHGYPYCRGRIFETVERDEGQYEDETEIFWASGAAMAVKRKAYLEAGGLDAKFFAHMEEIDLCWRLKSSGGKILYVPRSVVYHLGGASLDASSPRKTFLNFRNNLLMLHKNLPSGRRKTRLITLRRLLDTLAWGKFMLTGKFSHASAIFKAHREFARMRHEYNQFPAVDLLASECRRNILTDYYIRGKRN